MGIRIDQLSAPVWTERVNLEGLPIANTIPLGAGWSWNNVDAPPILDVDVPSLSLAVPTVHGAGIQRDNDRIVTRVRLVFSGGFYIDNMIIYWTGKSSKEINENKVYKFPVNIWSDAITVYIDDDVSRLMIVPFEFRWARIHMKTAVITKYVTGSEPHAGKSGSGAATVAR